MDQNLLKEFLNKQTQSYGVLWWFLSEFEAESFYADVYVVGVMMHAKYFDRLTWMVNDW
jgi:hypothetical protein